MKINSIIKYMKYALFIILLIYSCNAFFISLDNTPEIHFTFSYPNINKIELSNNSEKQIYNYLNNLDCDDSLDYLNFEPLYGEGNRFIEIRYQDDIGYYKWYLGGRFIECKFYPIDSRDEITYYKIDNGEAFEFVMQFYK